MRSNEKNINLELFQWIIPMADAGVNQYTFHIEPVTNVEDVCRKIKENGMKVTIKLFMYLDEN